MGPPIYIGGNKNGMGANGTHIFRFNGATDLHRWKLIIYPADNFSAGAASMGPPIYIGGNIARRCLSTRKDGVIASMGPPIYIGGNVPGNEMPSRMEYGFNGATDLHRWKRIAILAEKFAEGASMGPPIYIGGNQIF